MQISGNTILITGGATGIGLALAAALAEQNEVIVCGRRADRLDEAKRQIPSLHTRVVDVASQSGRTELVQWIESEFPRTNILVNNAGVQHRVDLSSVEELAKGEEEIAINLIAPLYLTALMLPQLRKQTAAAVVNVTSGLAFAPLSYMPVYCATKAALHSISLSLRHQLRDTTVRVFEAIPPLVRSELGATHRPEQLNRIAMPAEEAAALIVSALERDEYELAIGDAANSRARRESLFEVMNSRA
ncbi:MAG: SDR family oxidoreductase [Acidobacteriota bacterium]|nr:SDR family oxidoreductase [Acidobacteriota bacterium]